MWTRVRKIIIDALLIGTTVAIFLGLSFVNGCLDRTRYEHATQDR